MRPGGDQAYEIVELGEVSYHGSTSMLTSPTIRYDASLSDSVSSVSLDDESHMEEQYDARSASHDSPKDVPAKEVIDERAQVAPWRPFWLRSALLATFCGIFLALVVALSIMLIYSRRNDGLGSARSSLRHLWRFGPTAAVTIISVFWSRIELQILRYTPWWAIQEREHVEADEYLLDYTEMLLPTVLKQSFKRKHYLVTIASVTALLLKVQIVLSSSIFQMVGVSIERPADARLLDSFVVKSLNKTELENIEGAGIAQYSPVVKATAEGIRNFGLPLPFGVSDACAYQTFSTSASTGDLDSLSQRPSVDSPLTIVVDGLFMETECLKLESHTASVKQDTGDEFAFKLKFENCDTVITKRGTIKFPHQWDADGGWDEPKGTDRPCPSLPQDHPQKLFFASSINHNKDRDEFETPCAAVLCSGRSSLSKVRVVDDGISPKVTLAADEGSKTAFDMDPWAIMSLMFGNLDSVDYLGLDAWPVELYYSLFNRQLNMTDSSVYNSSMLHEAATFMMTYLGPMTAHTYLKEPEESLLQASSAEYEQRLQVNMGACIAITILSAICFCAVLFTLVSSQNFPKTDRRDPMTLLGLIVALYSNDQLRTSLGHSPASIKAATSKDAWSRCNFTPLIQRPYIRASFLLFVLVLVAGLGISLWRSQGFSGLATVSKDGYNFLLWQIAPALAMLIVSLYSASLDVSLRSLAVISRLSSKPCPAPELDESPFDMLGVRAWLYSCRRKMPSITLLQTVAMACTLLPIMSSVLFSPEPVPVSQEVTIQQGSWFGGSNKSDQVSPEYKQLRNSLSALLMIKNRPNITFPQNTYADLLFPNFTIDDSLWGQSRAANITLPAARLTSTCERLSNDEFEIVSSTGNYDLSRNYTCPTDGRQRSLRSPISNTASSSLLFGWVEESPHDPSFLEHSCSNKTTLFARVYYEFPWKLYTYAWGKRRNESSSSSSSSSSAEGDFEHLAVWECNYTWADVKATLNVVYSDGETLIDHSSPPLVHEVADPVRLWEPAFPIPNMYLSKDYLGLPGPTTTDIFPVVDVANDFGRRFGLIMQPFGPMVIEDLADPDKEGRILEALRSDLGFAAAQLANIEKRLGVNDDSSAATGSHHGYLQPINATVIDDKRYRLVQDEGITIAIMSILSVVFLIHAWALLSGVCRRVLGDFSQKPWFLDIGIEGLAPPQFSTLAMMDSLLRGSNMLDILPPDAHLMPKRELHQHLDGRRFGLGWFYSTATESHEYTLGALHDEDFAFKGRKQRFGKPGVVV